MALDIFNTETNSLRDSKLVSTVLMPVNCPELGNALRLEELLEKGFDPEKCGCLKKIRHCALHVICTTGVERPGIQCCITCPDRPIT